MYVGITNAAMYDTLGPEAITFVLKQTELTTVSTTASYVETFVSLKKEGSAQSLKNLVIWDAAS